MYDSISVMRNVIDKGEQLYQTFIDMICSKK